MGELVFYQMGPFGKAISLSMYCLVRPPSAGPAHSSLQQRQQRENRRGSLKGIRITQTHLTALWSCLTEILAFTTGTVLGLVVLINSSLAKTICQPGPSACQKFRAVAGGRPEALGRVPSLAGQPAASRRHRRS